MRWKGRRQSENVEVRGGAGAKVVGGGVGLLLAAMLVMLLGGDPSSLLNSAVGQGPAAASESAPPSPREQELREFASVVLADTEDVWGTIFRRSNREYREPKMVIYSGSVQSGCGFASSQVGPFYCGADETVYLDLSFFDELSNRYGAQGDFAAAYVIAHEVGHHIQKLLGTMDRVNRNQARASKRAANDLSVRLELRADYYAGVWAHHARQAAAIDEADIREAISATEAVGDDTIQRRAQGYVVPDAFTHGTAEQRTRWFLKGWKSGDPNGGDTFGTAQP